MIRSQIIRATCMKAMENCWDNFPSEIHCPCYKQFTYSHHGCHVELLSFKALGKFSVIETGEHILGEKKTSRNKRVNCRNLPIHGELSVCLWQIRNLSLLPHDSDSRAEHRAQIHEIF